MTNYEKHCHDKIEFGSYYHLLVTFLIAGHMNYVDWVLINPYATPWRCHCTEKFGGGGEEEGISCDEAIKILGFISKQAL